MDVPEAGQKMGKKADTIARILQQARILFWNEGYSNVTTQRIADNAGITKGLLTHYFPRKRDIVAEINFIDFSRIYSFAYERTGNDAFLSYIITLYILRKAFCTQPQLRQISEEAFAGRSGSVNLNTLTERDSVYIEIIKQFNINMTLDDIHHKVIMSNGASAALAAHYYSGESGMSLDEYLKTSVMICGAMLEIPYFIRTSYYDRAMELIDRGEIPEFDYLNNNY